MNENTSIDLDSLLDGTLDDLADLPESVPFHAGGHKISLSLEAKIKHKMKMLQIIKNTTFKFNPIGISALMVKNQIGRLER